MNIDTYLEPIRTRRALLGFSGWPDAGRLVHRIIMELRSALPVERVAVWDLDGFWHTEISRPQIMIQHGQIQRMDWPAYHFFLASPVGREPFLIGMGPEPGNQWRAFTDQMLDFLNGWGCEELYLLGSLSDQVFHDESLISGVAQDARGLNQIHGMDCRQIEYRGPCAIHGAIMEAARNEGKYCLSFWAHFPFYLDGPHEMLMARVLRVLATVLDLEIETDHLVRAWQEHERQINDLVRQDPELHRMMESPERTAGSSEAPSRPPKIIRLDEFLRKRREAESHDDDI